MTLEELELSHRTYNTLRRAGIDTVEQILEHTGKQLSQIRGMGPKSLTEIQEKLEAAGCSLLY